jgi:hypothetical protein
MQALIISRIDAEKIFGADDRAGFFLAENQKNFPPWCADIALRNLARRHAARILERTIACVAPAENALTQALEHACTAVPC